MSKITFIVGLAILFTCSCKKDDDTTGNKTTSVDVECTVNGKDWKMGKNDSFNIDGMADNKGAAVLARLSGKNLSFSLNKWDNVDSAAVVITAVLSDSIIGNYAFDFANDPANMHYIRYIKMDRSMGPPPDMTNSVGFFKVTSYDKVNNTISGEFEAVVTNKNFMNKFSTATISKGRFTNIELDIP